MSESMANKEVTDQILVALGDKLEREFGTRPDSDTTLRLAKDLKFVKGRQGRGGGTFPEAAGFAFLTSVSVPETDSCMTDCGCEDPGVVDNNTDEIPF